MESVDLRIPAKSSWTAMPRALGIAKSVWSDETGFEMELGEVVKVLAECPQWFAVLRLSGEKATGIVPKSYVQVRLGSVVQTGAEEVLVPNSSPIVQEMRDILKEWHGRAKELYLKRLPIFHVIRKKILDLHGCLKNILSPVLTVESQRELKKEIAEILDSGNNLLGFDVTVRDDEGEALDPSTTSTIDLFRRHQATQSRLSKLGVEGVEKSGTGTGSSHSLLVTCVSCPWGILDDGFLRLFLYDGSGGKHYALSEGGQIPLRPNTPITPTRFLFTDLGKRDRERGKVFLVAFIVRVGAMEYREDKRGNLPFAQKSSSPQSMRRPWGVGAREVTHLFRDDWSGGQEDLCLSYIAFEEHDSLRSALTKLLEPGSKEVPENKNFVCSFSMLADSSGEVVQVMGGGVNGEDQPLRLKANLFLVRKMGFPEVILPNDIRNDLYVTLLGGEFHRGSKTSDRNVEVTASLHNERGDLMRAVIWSGSGGGGGSDSYKSVVYYHDDKPKWDEIFKIALPMSIEDFSAAHLRFTFKHRSSSDTKDKGEKIFALAYMRLRDKDTGTAVSDDDHTLVVYKVDGKQYREGDVSYLSLPSTRRLSGGQLPKCPGLTLSPKDSFSVRTTLCSTKFTQNIHLLELLQWSTTLAERMREAGEKTNLSEASSRRTLGELLLGSLRRILNNVMEVSGEEIVKFLPDVFDALFTILVEPLEPIPERRDEFGLDPSPNPLSDTCDRHVFDCLIYIFGLILDRKYENFTSVLSHYIEDGFSATLAYKKLIHELRTAIDRGEAGKILKIMKSINFFFKFIIRSYSNRIQLIIMEIGGGEEEIEEEFGGMIQSVFRSMCGLLNRSEDGLVGAQSGCLRYVPSIIPPLSTCFSPPRLSELLVELLACGQPNKLVNYKLTAVLQIVHSPLFRDSVCRTKLFPTVSESIKHHLPGNDEDLRRRSQEAAKSRSGKKLVNMLGSGPGLPAVVPAISTLPTHSEETKQCVELLSEVLDILHQDDIGDTKGDITHVMQRLLKPVILSIGTIGDADPLAGNMVCILLGIFRSMSPTHYRKLVSNLKRESGKDALLEFLNDVLVVMRSLFQKPYFPASWAQMLLLQNSIILGVLEEFSETIRVEFQEPFQEPAWSNYFLSSAAFLTQPPLQLEDFSPRKRLSVLSTYGDMRVKVGELVHSMWFSLGESKRVKFVPWMVGTFLDMALVPQPHLRRTTIPIFFDMMRSEYAQEASFRKVENELVKRLVEFIEGGRGDPEFRDIFQDTMRERCDHDNSGLRTLGLEMVDMLSRLLEVLLEYREVVLDEDPGNRMTCIVNLLDFSKEVGRKDLYIRYLYKLVGLHVAAKNFTEAGFTLQLHSRQLEWVEEEVGSHLYSPLHPLLTSHSELKEALYYDIIAHFSQAQMWECGLEVCDELRQQYEETFNYAHLSPLLRRMAGFYENIRTTVRCEPEYFRVAFFGSDFPSFLHSKVFIFRGKVFEKLSDFEARILERFPHAELLRTLDKPSDEIQFASKQLLQVCKVSAVMSSGKRMSGMRYAEESIRKYYKSNDINKFEYSRPFYFPAKDPENEFASLWLDRNTLWTSQSFPGIMAWFPVIRETSVEVKPVVNAVERMEEMNQTLRDLVLSYMANPEKPLGDLTIKLGGTLDAGVNGGIAKYEKAFLVPDYLDREPGDADHVERLKKLIFILAPIAFECLRIHEKMASDALQPLQRHLQEKFDVMVLHLESTYGVNVKGLEDETLKREMERIHKKRIIQERREAVNATTPAVPRHSADLMHRGSVSQVLSRGKGSLSSTVSLYSSLPGKVSKSMASIPRPQMIHRKSKQESMDEPLGGTRIFFGGGSSMSKLTSISGGDLESEASSPTTGIGSQRPPRHSCTWEQNRHSGISVSSGQSITISIGGGSSEGQLDTEPEPAAPPLPPKQNREAKEVDSKPPAPPPKPPLRQVMN